MLRPVSEVADMEARLGLAGRYTDPVFQHSRRDCVGFVRDLVKAGSVEFVEDAVEHVGSSLLPRRLVLRGSSLMRVQATDVSVGCTRKKERPRTSCSRFLDISCPYNTSNRFFFGDVFLSRRHGSLRALGDC